MKLFGQRYPEEIAGRIPPGQRPPHAFLSWLNASLTIAPSANGRPGSGTSSVGCTRFDVPNPAQVRHAPEGSLNVKWA